MPWSWRHMALERQNPGQGPHLLSQMGFLSQWFDSALRGLEMSLSLVSEGQLPLGVCHRQRVFSPYLHLKQAASIQPLKLGSSFTHPGHGGHFCDAVNVPSINPLFPCWMEGCMDRWSL